jgi:hypothetical protein
MKTMTKVLTAAAVLVVALSLSAPVGAACGAPALITTITASGSTFVFNPTFASHYSFFYGPYGPAVYSYDGANPAPTPLSAAASISFWAVGTGDPAFGVGNDNGPYDMVENGGFYFGGYTYSATIPGGYLQAGRLAGTWENPTAAGEATDGCVGGNNCMCVLISDQDGTEGFYAIAGALSDATFSTSINLGGSDGNGNNLPIALVNIAAPSITDSVRDQGSFDVNLGISAAAPAGGNYVQNGCACGPSGFQVLQMIVPRGNMPPSDRDIGAWTVPTLGDGVTPQPVTAFGGTVTVRSSCGTSDTDVYLSTGLVFDSSFGTAVVSGNSSRVECGPNVANPLDNNPSADRPGNRGDRGKPRRR